MNRQKDKFALIVGVGDDLPYTVDDANRIFETLTNPDRIGYEVDKVCLKVNEAANRAGILEGLDFLVENAGETDTVLIYYSGHGGTYKYEEKGKTKHQFFLQPHGMRADNYKTHWIKAEELTERVNKIKSNRIVFLLDCCHAEGMTQGGLVKMNEMAQQLNNEGGIWVISSSQDNEKSWRLPDAQNSLFTECFLEVLTGRHKTPFNEPFVTIIDVVEHIFEEVPKRASGVLDDKTGKPIQQHPYAKFQMAENVILSHFDKKYSEYQETVDKMLPNFKNLSVSGVKELIASLRLLGNNQQAINLLESHPNIEEEQDFLNLLGELFKDEYLISKNQETGMKAINTHLKAWQMAKDKEDLEQLYLNSINLAFLALSLGKNEKEIYSYVELAKGFALSSLLPNPNKLATLCEVSLYENNLNKAEDYLNELSLGAGIRFKLLTYREISATLELLYGKNANHPFLKTLEKYLLN